MPGQALVGLPERDGRVVSFVGQWVFAVCSGCSEAKGARGILGTVVIRVQVEY